MKYWIKIFICKKLSGWMQTKMKSHEIFIKEKGTETLVSEDQAKSLTWSSALELSLRSCNVNVLRDTANVSLVKSIIKMTCKCTFHMFLSLTSGIGMFLRVLEGRGQRKWTSLRDGKKAFWSKRMPCSCTFLFLIQSLWASQV